MLIELLIINLFCIALTIKRRHTLWQSTWSCDSRFGISITPFPGHTPLQRVIIVSVPPENETISLFCPVVQRIPASLARPWNIECVSARREDGESNSATRPSAITSTRLLSSTATVSSVTLAVTGNNCNTLLWLESGCCSPVFSRWAIVITVQSLKATLEKESVWVCFGPFLLVCLVWHCWGPYSPNLAVLSLPWQWGASKGTNGVKA